MQQSSPAITHTTVLIVTLGLEYVAPSRMPRELRFAGCKVAMLAPPDSWATQTRFIELLGHLPLESTQQRMLDIIIAAVQKTQATLLLPGDDAIVLALMRAAIAARTPAAATPQDTAPPAAPVAPITALIQHSLGDPVHYANSIDKGRLVDRARAAGIEVPAGDAVGDIDDALRVARALGYPVIVRPTVGTSSMGVAMCGDEAELRAAIAALPADAGARWPHARAPALVQKFLTGRRYNRAVAAWRGHEIAGYSRMALERWPSALSPASVASFVHAPAVAAASEQVVEALGVSGFAGIQFIDDQDTGRPCLIEINRRMVPATHAGRHAGVDLAAALAGALQGVSWTGLRDTAVDQQRGMVLFPQEWKRDFRSEHFATLPTDAPWDDPRLFAAMLNSPR